MGIGLRVITKTATGAVLLLLLLTPGCSKKEAPKPPNSTATPTPIPLLPRKVYETARLFNGITLKSSLEAIPSEDSSLHLEKQPDSYTLQLELHFRVPQPAISAKNLLAATPELGKLLPNLGELLTNATASPDFATLYLNKEKNLRSNLNTLQRLLPLDTIYDCQTILNLQNTATSRRAILIQALMNVNTDGSDGDRNLDADIHSPFFQPQTNYRWPKITARPNPYLHEAEHLLAVIRQKLPASNSISTAALTNPAITPISPLSEAEKSRLLAAESDEKTTLEELKHFSFLVGTADPFIALPSFMFTNAEGHPQIGDYAIVIANGTLYPAILGDKGPNFKIGEASLRLCKEIDGTSTADIRPVDHPTVTYLIFPGSAEKPFSAPDYKHWSERCHALWKEFGGSDPANWQEWDSLEKPWPTPTPSPTPTPTLSVSPAESSSRVPLTSPAPDTSSGTNPASYSTPTNTAATNLIPSNTPH